MPAGLAYEPGSAELVAGPFVDFDSREHSDGTLTLSVWTGTHDKKAILRFNATTRSAPGEQIEGRALVTWTSLAGASAEERTGAGGVNDYLREASARVNIVNLTLTKTADPRSRPGGRDSHLHPHLREPGHRRGITTSTSRTIWTRASPSSPPTRPHSGTTPKALPGPSPALSRTARMTSPCRCA